MREEIDSVKIKIDQILETLLTLARREEEFYNATAARNDVPVEGSALLSRPTVLIPNHVIYGLPPSYTHPFEGVTHQLVCTSRVTDGVST